MATSGSGNTMSSGNKRKDDPVAQDVHDKLELMPLGAGNEVGRSCVYMSYKGKNVLFDCGIHPGRSGLAGLPFFDEIDPSLIDVLLVTHFHLDHSASLPYFLLKTNFKGRVFMTHATKAVYRLLLSDFVKVSKVATEDALFTEQEIAQSMDRIEVIDFHQVQEVNGIRFWCYTAGHVLGAAMFMVDIAGVRVLYTGDYSREEDRHLKAAEVPPFSPDLCVIESTFGISIHEPREERERRFVDVVTNTVLGGGRVLIPAFALGRAQELLLILDEHWRMHPELQHIPLLYASPLARKTMVVYRTYTGSMNDRIREQCEESNPFDFKFIKSLRSMAEFEDTGPAVVMASPGGLQSGLSRQLFDLWCGDHRNTCLIPGYVVEGTLAKTLLSEPKEVTLMNGSVVPLHMQIHYISFAAHADFEQTSSFLETLQPPNIVLVHGEATAMGRLRSKLMEQFKDRNTSVLMPKNCQTVDFYFKGDKIAKAVGKLTGQKPRPIGSSEGDVKAGVKSESGASREEGNVVPGDAPSEEDGNVVRGVLVRKEFSYQLVAPEELSAYTHLSTGAVIQRQSIPYRGPFSAVKFRLQRMFEGVEDAKDVDWPAVSVQKGKITVGQECEDRLVLQWVSDPVSDMVADSIVSAVLQLEGARSPMRGGSERKLEGLEEEQQEKEVDRTEGENSLVRILLREMFGDVEELPRVEGKERLRVTMDDAEVVVVLPEGEVEGRDENLKNHVNSVIARCLRAVRPLSLS